VALPKYALNPLVVGFEQYTGLPGQLKGKLKNPYTDVDNREFRHIFWGKTRLRQSRFL
jgi:hypothetical protein